MSSTFNKLLALAAIAAVSAVQARAQYSVGFTADAVSSLDNRANSRLVVEPRNSRPLAATYSLYPSLTLTGKQRQSALSLSYAYGVDRIERSTPVTKQSHSGNLAFAPRLSQNWMASFSDSFESTDDSATFNALRGTSASPDLGVGFNPVAANITSRSNNARVSFDHALNAKSTLSFQVAHTLRTYGGDPTVRTGSLSNQQGASATVSLTTKLKDMDEWGLVYTASYSDFKEFRDSRFQSGKFRYSVGLSRTVKAELGVGISQVHSVGTAVSYTGYDARALLSKETRSGALSGRYEQNSGQQTGLGGTSNVRSASASWRQQLNRSLSVFSELGAFESRGALGNQLRSKSYTGTGNLGYSLNSKFSIHVGGQLQRNVTATPFALSQKRVFISLKYNEPKLLDLR